MNDSETIRVYDARADEYADLTDQHAETNQHLTAFLQECTPGGRVLDLGCGPGASAAAMARAGMHVDATDASGEMAALAGRHPGVTARQQTYDDISGQDLYDGVWANFSLLHAPRSSFATYLAALHLALKPGGVFHIGLKLGEGENRDSIGRLYTYFTEPELIAYLNDAGFHVLRTSYGADKGMDGKMADWICILSRS